LGSFCSLDGEILVAAQTDIAWTLLFPRASAIVTDVGALLSHAAIVAHELGIPAVVGCGNATMRLRTGDQMLLNGGAGSCRDSGFRMRKLEGREENSCKRLL